MIFKPMDGLEPYQKPALVKYDNLLDITAEWQCSAGIDRHGNQNGQGHSEHGNGNGYGHCTRI